MLPAPGEPQGEPPPRNADPLQRPTAAHVEEVPLAAAQHFKVLPKAAYMRRERVVKVSVPLQLGKQAGQEEQVNIDELLEGY